MAQPAPCAARRTVFESDLLRIGHVMRRGPAERGDIERQEANVLVFPLRGVFAQHDGPRRQFIGTPNHVVSIAAHRPYRVSFPGGIGEECMTLWPAEPLDAQRVHSCSVLPAPALLARSLLWRLASGAGSDRIEVEELSVALLAAVSGGGTRREASQRRQRLVARVKEAIAAQPERRWTLSALAHVASASSYHLARVFREEAGTRLHRYVTQARLGVALERVLDADTDLTTIALDSGFASHSHFTARFRALFGMTPSELRNARSAAISQVRKILTAPLPAAA